MVRSHKANKADESETERAIAEIPKKKRIMSLLVSYTANNKWLSVKDLQHIASRGYLYPLMKGFFSKGLVVKQYRRTSKGRETIYQATDKLISLVSSQEEGQLPRGVDFGAIPRSRALQKRTGKRTKSYETQLIKVKTVDATERLGVDHAYTENIRVSIPIDPAVANRLREAMNPPSKGDRAKQHTIHIEAFTLTISNRNQGVFVLLTKQWADALAQFCIISGISKRSIKVLVAQVNSAIPDGDARVEFPVFLAALKDLEVSYEMRTEIIDDLGNPTGYIITSNINHSMLVDYEVLGKVYAVNGFLSTMSAMQHNAAVSYASIKIQMEKEAEEQEKQRIEAEKKLDKDIADQEEKKKENDDWKRYYV